MKKILNISLFVIIIALLSSCSTIDTEFVELEQCIDDLVKAQENGTCYIELLEDYANTVFGEDDYTIPKRVTYDDSGFHTITVEFQVASSENTVSVESYNSMETIFVTILNDFNEMNDDIRYDITINYINTDNNYSLEFTKNSYYSMLRVLFTDSDDFETAYGDIEDLLKHLSNNTVFDAIRFDLNASDFQTDITLSIEQGYYDFVIMNSDNTSTNTFDNITESIHETMEDSDLIAYMLFQQKN